MSARRHLRTWNLSSAEDSWIHAASSTGIIAVSSTAGFVIFGTAAMWEWLASEEGWPLLPMAIVADVLAGAVAGTFLYTILRNLRRRRMEMLQRLAAIRQMHHEIRNALDLIQLSAYTTKDKDAIAMIRGAVDRIQWTLREIIPFAEWERGSEREDTSER